MRLLVETREAFLVRDVTQPALEIVGPAVIAADEGARASGAARYLHAAMPASVAEGPDLAVGPAHHDDRRTGRFAGDVRARLRQRRRRTERSGRAPQDACDLRRKSLCRSIVRDRFAPHLLPDIRRAIGDVVEHPLRHGPIIHCRFHSCHPLPAILSSIRPAIRRTKETAPALREPHSPAFCSATCTAPAKPAPAVLHECNMASRLIPKAGNHGLARPQLSQSVVVITDSQFWSARVPEIQSCGSALR
jgi:hypothetical protein